MGLTFCLIKPEAFDRRDEIEEFVEDNDFSLVIGKEQEWTKGKIRKTYTKEKLHYPTDNANSKMSELIPDAIYRKFPNPMVEALIISSEGDITKRFIDLCGPTRALEYVKEEFRNTLRGKYGLGPECSFVTVIDGKECSFDFNAVHKTTTEKEFETERKIYF